ncbi:hypothetical protein [Lactobacillus hominis]|uniref:Uncharacterized protein n=1 Tax=Lactobacillus hominis DSM 23910 = CRBIP 24.179 TaxID=1423758 RepID=I7KGX5_9LACO|nr:hypothetical protein [Lactobacillus hominis]KRM84113.1 hypothetical protein FC41_GL001480 [Lactobacillus hominis DSM 23910 = CRBIP 24.179]MCT3348968.1 hypothetical protein [Lactobacillus hominis]CCI81645.1 Protein of unknown function [Lactobacillus hominis DSM 23910 = CRBIP 24.179]
MIKEIMTSEGNYFKELNGQRAVPTSDVNYVPYQTDLTASTPTNALYIDSIQVYGRANLNNNKGYIAKIGSQWGFVYENAVRLVGGVKSTFIKLLHRFSLRGVVC